MARKPLEGLRVLDCGIVQAGPFITRLMGDWGAEVIRVESRTHLDPARTSHYPENTPGKEYWNQGAVFHEQMRNKLSVTLELDNPKGADLLRRLAAVSDVLEESYPPRVMRKFGLDYASLKEVNPRLIYISSLGYGYGGPYSPYRNYGMITEAMGGISWLNGYQGGPPMRSAIPYTDHPSTYMGFLAVMAALEYRRRTGQGQWIDVSQYEVGIQMIGDAYVERSLSGQSPPRLGNPDPMMAPHDSYPCAGDDAWIAIAVRSDDDWQRLRQAMGDPLWARDQALQTLPGRLQRRDEIDQAIAGWTSDQEPYALQSLLQSHGVPAGVTLNAKTLLLDPHLRERGFYTMVEHHPGQERAGRRPFPAATAVMSRTPGGIHLPAPMLGQHNEQVFCGLLGLDREALTALEEEGVIGTDPVFAGGPLPPTLSPQERLKVTGQGRIRSFDPDYREILDLDTPARSDQEATR